MKRKNGRVLLGVVSVLLVAAVVGAAELTVDSILAAERSGAPAKGIIAMVENPANTTAFTIADIVTLRDAGVPESVIAAVWARVPATTQAPVALQPDDARLVELVSLITSGMSEQIITDQVEQANTTYNLTVNDLLYLKQNQVPESTIEALMATRSGTAAAPAMAPPAELAFDNLVLVKTGLFRFFRKDHPGRLVMDGDTLGWEDVRGTEGSFEFQTTGIDKVWMTCEARSSGNFCHQINFQIVKGDLFRFQDSRRESGSNAAVLEVLEALRTYFPRLTIGTPKVGD
jgi:hypothetical protein